MVFQQRHITQRNPSFSTILPHSCACGFPLTNQKIAPTKWVNEALPLATRHRDHRIQEIHLSHNMFTSEGVPHLSLRGWWGWGRLGGDFWVVLVASVGWILGDFFGFLWMDELGLGPGPQMSNWASCFLNAQRYLSKGSRLMKLRRLWTWPSFVGPGTSKETLLNYGNLRLSWFLLRFVNTIVWTNFYSKYKLQHQKKQAFCIHLPSHPFHPLTQRLRQRKASIIIMAAEGSRHPESATWMNWSSRFFGRIVKKNEIVNQKTCCAEFIV